MAEACAELKVVEVAERSGFSVVILRGHVKGGEVLAGMSIKVWVDGGLYMRAPITSVEQYENESGLVQLTLDAPESEARELWVGLCQAGDTLVIEKGGK